MEGGSKKRKICCDDGDDEVNMEKFFDLIRTIQKARDHMMTGSEVSKNTAENQKTKKRNLLEEERVVAVWNPTFQPEDFIEDAQSVNPPVNLAQLSQIKEETEKEDKEELDLKLAL